MRQEQAQWGQLTTQIQIADQTKDGVGGDADEGPRRMGRRRPSRSSPSGSAYCEPSEIVSMNRMQPASSSSLHELSGSGRAGPSSSA